MWLGLPVLILAVLALVGAVVGGGVFTLVLVPIAILFALAAIGYSMWNRASHPHETEQGTPTSGPLPHSNHSNASVAPSTPDQLVDARQKQQ